MSPLPISCQQHSSHPPGPGSRPMLSVVCVDAIRGLQEACSSRTAVGAEAAAARPGGGGGLGARLPSYLRAVGCPCGTSAGRLSMASPTCHCPVARSSFIT